MIEKLRCNMCGEAYNLGDSHTCRESKIRLIRLAEEKGFHGLVAALKNAKVNDSLKDLQDFGWIRCIIDYPPYNEEVLVTNGKEQVLAVWLEGNLWQINSYDIHKVRENIIAWTYKPDLTELQECMNIEKN